MAVFVWVMVGLAIWHFTVYLPDHFWGGIAGAFVGAIIGSVLGGLAVNGFSVPSRADVHLITLIEALPGIVIGMGVVYAEGLRREKLEREEQGQPTGLTG